jgi:putative transcriptional regulator
MCHRPVAAGADDLPFANLRIGYDSMADSETSAMLRVRLKADGRLVEILPDGTEHPLAMPADGAPPARPPAVRRLSEAEAMDAAYARGVRGRTGLTQAAFAARIGVPIETVRNWEQGKRHPRGPARALLKLIDQAPDVAFATLGRRR